MKKIYRRFIRKLDELVELLYIFKVGAAEWVAILKKRKLYHNVKISINDLKRIDDLWKPKYGKKISKKWHKLYISINNQFKCDYFPDYIFSTKLEPKLNPIKIAKFYSDKSLTELIYKSVKNVKFPETIIVNCSGYFYSNSRDIITKYEAIRILLNFDEFVIKPTIGGSSGNSVQLVSLVKKNSDKKVKYLEDIFGQYDSDFIVQKRLKPHHAFKALYPYSINTIRLITYIVKNKVYHAPLSLRMGLEGKNIDNIHSGGIVVGLSDDGYLKKYAYKLGYCDSNVKLIEHPDSGVLFDRYQIPGTIKTIELAKELHVNTPHLGIISWDFMIDDIGDTVLVEGNYLGQAIWFPQVVNEASVFGNNTSEMISLVSK
jgi:hypothetical protein